MGVPRTTWDAWRGVHQPAIVSSSWPCFVALPNSCAAEISVPGALLPSGFKHSFMMTHKSLPCPFFLGGGEYDKYVDL